MFRVALRHLAPSAFMLVFFSACDKAPEFPTLPQAANEGAPAAPAAASVGTQLLVSEKYQLRTSASVSRARTIRWRSSNPAVASVNSHGVVEALSEGAVEITASGNGKQEDTFAVDVYRPVGVDITVSKTELGLGERAVATAAIRASDGTLLPPRENAVWSVESGSAVTVSASGEITGVAAGSAIVSATTAGVTGTQVFTVTGSSQNPNDPTVTAFSISPKTTTVTAGTSKQFTTAATWSDNATRSVEVTFTATGGTIDAAGLFQAGSEAGTYSVVATCGCGRKDTATVTISSVSAPTLTSLQISPKSVALLLGATQQFVVTGTWSDNATRTIPVSYTAVGGAVTSGGLYTAPGAAGTYKVIVAHSDGPLRDTATVVVTVPGTGPSYVTPALPQAFVDLTYPIKSGTTRYVTSGSNLQNALNAAQPGDEIVLQNGATFTGNFTLPAKTGDAKIVIRSETVPAPAGSRVTPALMTNAAKVVTPNSQPAIRAANGARNWRLVGFEVTQVVGLTINYGLIVLGDGTETTLSQLPSDIVLDRMFVHGPAEDNSKRCVQMNGARQAVIDSWISDCHGKGFDAQGIAGWAGPGPFHIENNRIEGSGMAIIFGGSDPMITGVSPSDIIIRRNHLYKPLSWGNGKWTVKATFELKHAKRVLFEGNVLENHWANAQEGYAILFQVVSEDGRAYTWTTIQDVTLRNNIIKNSRSGVNILSRAGYTQWPVPPDGTRRVLLYNNLFLQVGKDYFGGWDGKTFQLLGDLQDITVLNNTIAASPTNYNGFSLDGAPQLRLTIANNVMPQTTYGIIGAGTGIGKVALDKYAPGAVVMGNVFPGQPSSSYPTGNFFPSSANSISFVQPELGNYALTPINTFYTGPFGMIGIDYLQLSTATAGVAQ